MLARVADITGKRKNKTRNRNDTITGNDCYKYTKITKPRLLQVRSFIRSVVDTFFVVFTS